MIPMQEEGRNGRKSSVKGKFQQGISPTFIVTAVVMTGLIALSRYARQCLAFPLRACLSYMTRKRYNCPVSDRVSLYFRFWKRRKWGSASALLERNVALPKAGNQADSGRLSGLRVVCAAL